MKKTTSEGESLRLVDTHAHLEEFQDIKGIVERAKEAGVAGIVGVGVGYASNLKTLEFSKTYRGYVFPAIGVHPTEVEKEDVDEGIKLIEQRIGECVAIGEIGLDYWTKINKEKQNEVFERLLEIAAKKDKPISVHTRGAWTETYDLVEQFNIKKAVFHWYTGPLETLKKILDRGYYVSASPAAEYSKKLRENLRQTSLEGLLLETDCPVKYNGVESEPADVRKTLKYVAELKGIREAMLAERTTENAMKLFGIDM